MSRGRASTPHTHTHTIVGPNELLSREYILHEDWCLLELDNHLRERITVLRWLA